MQDKIDRIASEKLSLKKRQQRWIQKTPDKCLRLQSGTRKRRNYMGEEGKIRRALRKEAKVTLCHEG